MLDTRSGVTWVAEEAKTYEFSNVTPYLYYRINVSANNGAATLGIGELKLFESFPGGKITEDYVHPASPADGDLSVLINQKPLKPYLRQSSSWVEKQFVKLGEVTKAGGTLGTPISYAFNGYSIIKQTGISGGSNYIINHKIGSDLIEPIGYYENLSGWTLTIPSDQTGKFYLNGYGDYASNSSGTNIVNIHKNTLRLVTEYYIWSSLGEYGYGRAATGDLTLITKRGF